MAETGRREEVEGQDGAADGREQASAGLKNEIHSHLHMSYMNNP